VPIRKTRKRSVSLKRGKRGRERVHQTENHIPKIGPYPFIGGRTLPSVEKKNQRERMFLEGPLEKEAHQALDKGKNVIH